MAKHIGIDLGTANTLVYMKGRGIILREPSVVAINQLTKKVVAVGGDAKRMLGKTPGNIVAYPPLKDGVIADFDVTAKMLHQFFVKTAADSIFSSPSVIICIPHDVTEVERRAVEDATFEAGAKSVALIEEPIAAAIGSGLRIRSPRGSMIVDIGSGTTEVAVLSLGGVVVSRSLRVAGNEIDDAIVQFMRREYQVLIGDGTAEALKKNIGSVYPGLDRGEMEIRGRNLRTGLPAVMTLTSDQMRAAMKPQIESILDTVCSALEATPPELSADLYDFGIMLAGGGALLGGLAPLLSERTGVRVTVAKKPLDSVALGIGRVIEGGMDGVVNYRAR